MALTGKRLYTCALQIQWLLVSWEYHAEQHRHCSKFLRTVLLPTEGTANMKALKRGSTEEATRRPVVAATEYKQGGQQETRSES